MFFMQEGGRNQIGGVSAASEAATRALLGQLMQTTGDPVSCFIWDEAPGLTECLSAHGFHVSPFHYLTRPLQAALPAKGPYRSWRESDAQQASHLLFAAYDFESSRAFVPRHAVESWREYVEHLMRFSGCGVFNPSLSRVLELQGQLRALVTSTMLSADTIHLAQVAVHPANRRRGIAESIVSEVLAAAASNGMRQASLLVSADNTAALTLYRALGFVERSRFVSARRN
jgi:ribosomal protein S18 acetylase RimI-like enzyme